jgi:hypothetical protein
LLAFSFRFQSSKVESYLAQIPGFSKPSIFKNEIYKRCSSFEQLSVTDAANQIINPDSFDVHLMNACIFYATQQYRLKHNRNPLKISKPATMAASLWAAVMAKDKTFHGHFHPTPSDIKSLPRRMAIFDNRFEYEPCSENTHH